VLSPVLLFVVQQLLAAGFLSSVTASCAQHLVLDSCCSYRFAVELQIQGVAVAPAASAEAHAPVVPQSKSRASEIQWF
jgi:hypothetical protein